MPTSVSARDYAARAYTIGVSGSTQSGRPTLLLAVCRLLRDNYSIAVVTSHPAPDQDGTREFLIRHKALTPSRIAVVDRGPATEQAMGAQMTEFRPELIFLEGAAADREGIGSLVDFTIHIVDGCAERISSEDVTGAESSDLLVLNKTHLGPPLDPERNVSVRESVCIRGDAPYVFAQLRYGIGAIEIARHILGRWRQTSAPAAWAAPLAGHALLAPA